jgi:hypothetical protein
MIMAMNKNYSNTALFTGAKDKATLFRKFGVKQLPFALNMRPFPYLRP